jgi:hypothetical protein
VAFHGRDRAGITAFCDAADGLSKTVVMAVTENGKSICGGYLDRAWREGATSRDDSNKSFLFTLKNHLRVGPTKFPKKDNDWPAAYKRRDKCWHFGYWEGPYMSHGENPGVPAGGSGLGEHYQDVGEQGLAIFNGGQVFFRLARWELWQFS